FGWRNTGEIIYLENHTTDWTRPAFEPHVLDARHGAIHVPVCDLNKDGRPDFVALISQEHETIVAFLNEGHANFARKRSTRAHTRPTVPAAFKWSISTATATWTSSTPTAT